MKALIVTTVLALLLNVDDFHFVADAFYCLVAALLYAFHIIVTNRFVREIDPLQLGI